MPSHYSCVAWLTPRRLTGDEERDAEWSFEERDTRTYGKHQRFTSCVVKMPRNQGFDVCFSFPPGILGTALASRDQYDPANPWTGFLIEVSVSMNDRESRPLRYIRHWGPDGTVVCFNIFRQSQWSTPGVKTASLALIPITRRNEAASESREPWAIFEWKILPGTRRVRDYIKRDVPHGLRLDDPDRTGTPAHRAAKKRAQQARSYKRPDDNSNYRSYDDRNGFSAPSRDNGYANRHQNHTSSHRGDSRASTSSGSTDRDQESPGTTGLDVARNQMALMSKELNKMLENKLYAGRKRGASEPLIDDEVRSKMQRVPDSTDKGARHRQKVETKEAKSTCREQRKSEASDYTETSDERDQSRALPDKPKYPTHYHHRRVEDGKYSRNEGDGAMPYGRDGKERLILTSGPIPRGPRKDSFESRHDQNGRKDSLSRNHSEEKQDQQGQVKSDNKHEGKLWRPIGGEEEEEGQGKTSDDRDRVSSSEMALATQLQNLQAQVGLSAAMDAANPIDIESEIQKLVALGRLRDLSKALGQEAPKGVVPIRAQAAVSAFAMDQAGSETRQGEPFSCGPSSSTLDRGESSRMRPVMDPFERSEKAESKGPMLPKKPVQVGMAPARLSLGPTEKNAFSLDWMLTKQTLPPTPQAWGTPEGKEAECYLSDQESEEEGMYPRSLEEQATASRATASRTGIKIAPEADELRRRVVTSLEAGKRAE